MGRGDGGERERKDRGEGWMGRGAEGVRRARGEVGRGKRGREARDGRVRGVGSEAFVLLLESKRDTDTKIC